MLRASSIAGGPATFPMYSPKAEAEPTWPRRPGPNDSLF